MINKCRTSAAALLRCSPEMSPPGRPPRDMRDPNPSKNGSVGFGALGLKLRVRGLGLLGIPCTGDLGTVQPGELQDLRPENYRFSVREGYNSQVQAMHGMARSRLANIMFSVLKASGPAHPGRERVCGAWFKFWGGHRVAALAEYTLVLRQKIPFFGSNRLGGCQHTSRLHV